MSNTQLRVHGRIQRHRRLRKKVTGTPARPRLCVFRSLKHLYAQVVDDTRGLTLASACTREKSVREGLSSTGNLEAAKRVGEVVAQRAKERGIEGVVFDRGGYNYHGRVKALAEAARAAGMRF